MGLKGFSGKLREVTCGRTHVKAVERKCLGRTRGGSIRGKILLLQIGLGGRQLAVLEKLVEKAFRPPILDGKQGKSRYRIPPRGFESGVAG